MVRLDALTDAIVGVEEGARARARWSGVAALGGGAFAVDIASLLSCAYPALEPQLFAWPEIVLDIAESRTSSGAFGTRDNLAYERAMAAVLPPIEDVTGLRRALRRFAFRERVRIALRELLPGARNDVDVTARELSDLADVCIEAAVREALAWADARFGVPRAESRARCPFVVVGMGKLGGRELNAGSDIDLLLFYETDNGSAGGITLHEYFTRVAQRLTATLGATTEDGIVWRVDLRLRPEGSRGPLVNALAAAERYYETWGRTWERVALIRARPAAGDRAFGKRVLAALAPFVWRREVRPQIADEMHALVLRARAELGDDPERDLKYGPGGIREAEFFVQSLQLVWGGREPDLRVRGMLPALGRLRSLGFVTEREAQAIETSYLALRRLEHRVQFATGLQTHALPSSTPLLDVIARSLGFSSGEALGGDLRRVRREVGECMASLLVREDGAAARREVADSARLFDALDSGDEDRVLQFLRAPHSRFPSPLDPAIARHLVALAKRPDAPLGASSRDAFPALATTLLDALADAADPEQAARLLAALFARLSTPSV
jgi:glutamate-ammonia-ligase adenylyltransferase